MRLSIDGCHRRPVSVNRGHDVTTRRHRDHSSVSSTQNVTAAGSVRGRIYCSTTGRLLTSRDVAKHHVTDVNPAFTRSITTRGSTEVSPLCPPGGSLCGSGNIISYDGSSSSLPISSPPSSRQQSQSCVTDSTSGTNGSGRRHRRPNSTGNGNCGDSIQMVVFTSGSSTMTTCCSGRPMLRDQFD